MVISSPQSHDKRRHLRHTRTIRVRFIHEGGEHLGVTTSVSLSGAFIRADHVPNPGTILLLEERFSPSGRSISMLGEVVWSLPTPSLDRPDTGFGFRFFELATAAGANVIEEFLSDLDNDYRNAVDVHVVPDEGLGGVRAIMHFPLADLDPELFQDLR
ncbi:MAG: PilZ domain-containing protein [Myxococcota bacterium]